MSIRRKSTSHDLATLRLHPDGSRVQQSSINRRPRKARSTVPDTRGNWIARDAGGNADVSSTRTRRASAPAEEQDGEVFDMRVSDDGLGEEDVTVQTNVKGKQKAAESDEVDSSRERTGKGLRSRKRRSFAEDFSFLAPSPYRFNSEAGSEPESSSEDDSSPSSKSASKAIKIALPDPSPELLKCIHHFASRYYQEKGVLSDKSRCYRDERKARRSNKSEANVHYQTTTKPTLWTRHSSLDGDGEEQHEGDEDEWEDEDEDQTEDAEGHENPSRQEQHSKDMYKALDGSALVAIGIILQEQIAHAMTVGFTSSHPRPVQRRDDSAERSSSSP